jgi:glycosyltransferase involved in cell wall biosynthesis
VNASAPRQPPRHAMVVHAYYPLAETRVQREAEALVRAGYAVDVICLRHDGEAARERVGGVDVHRLPVQVDKRSLRHQFVSYLRFFALASARLARQHARRPYRSVQVHNLPDFLVFCALVPKLQRVPVILDLHDLMPEFFAGRFGAGGRRWVGRLIGWQERMACRFADHVVTVSDHWRDTLIERGVAPDKCSVVMNVADERIFTPHAPRRCDDGTFRVIYHGSVTPRYGLDLAVRAVGLVRDEIPGIRLTVLGRGDHMPELERLRRELALEREIELRDEYLAAEHLPAIIASADLGIVPYRDDVFTDALLPTKLMEYAAMGLPCVVARTTAIHAYFAGSMVEFFAPGDVEELALRLRELHRSPRRRNELARRSAVFTDRYGWERLAPQYVALVDALGPRLTPSAAGPAPRTGRCAGRPIATAVPRRT